VPLNLKRYYGAGDLHFITFSCYRRLAGGPPYLSRRRVAPVILGALRELVHVGVESCGASEPEAILRRGRPSLHHFQLLSPSAISRLGQATRSLPPVAGADSTQIRVRRARIRGARYRAVMLMNGLPQGLKPNSLTLCGTTEVVPCQNNTAPYFIPRPFF
jgi:hypothetical protein